VVFIGDICDFHSINFHDHNPALPSPSEEIKIDKEKIKEWYSVFPNALICRGNHDNLPVRKGMSHGLPSEMIREVDVIMQFPKQWIYRYDFIIDKVRYFHGTGYSGKYAHIKAIHDNRMSVVMGHLHSVAGVEFSATKKDICFGMSVGCGINIKSPAFGYGEDYVRKPILGCGVVSYTDRGINAQFVPMELT